MEGNEKKFENEKQESVNCDVEDPNSNGLEINEKLAQLLKLTDSYSAQIGISSSSSLPQKKRDGRARSHLLTEKEEDEILLRDAEEGAGEDAILKQPSAIRGTMKPYQLEGLNWLYQLYKNNINGILADEMGLGKTLQSIAVLAYLKTVKGLGGPHLVIGPRSTLDNWENEFTKWWPEACVVKLHGSKEERERIVSEHMGASASYDVCLTTYEMVIREKTKLNRIHWHYLIMDEAHRIKNEKSILSEVVRSFSPQRRLLITGTPLQNNLKELWSLLNFLMPSLFNSCADLDGFFDFSRLPSEQEQGALIGVLHRILKPFMIRRLKVDAEKELPPKREIYIFVGLTKLQKQIYSGIVSKNVEVLNCMSGGKSQMLNILMQLRKCCNHPYLFDGVEPGPPYVEGEHMVNAAGKMMLLRKLLPRFKAEKSRVLIFSQMTRLIDILDDFCRWNGYPYCRIDGGTPGPERQQRIDDFNRPDSDKFIFLLSTRAGGLGINLATANIVILYDSDFNPQMDLQAMDRAHRIGQRKKVMVYRFVSERTVEERIVERAAKKLKLDSLIIQKGRFSSKVKGPESTELRDMIQFGAQEVYRTQNESSVTEADIDLILTDAEQRTDDINRQLSSLGSTFNLSSLCLEGGLKMYDTGETVQGVEESTKKIPTFFELGDRRTKWKPEEKKPVKRPVRKSLSGWRLEVGGGFDHQLYNAARLDELDELKKNWDDYINRVSLLKKGGNHDGEKPGFVMESSKIRDCVTLRSLSEDELREVLAVIEDHMGVSFDHTSKTKMQLYKRVQSLLVDGGASAPDFEFDKSDFSSSLLSLKNSFESGEAWDRGIPSATLPPNRNPGKATRLRKGTQSSKKTIVNPVEQSEDSDEEIRSIPKPPKMTRELIQERTRLMSEGFASWTRSDLNKLVRGLEQHGRENLETVQQLMASEGSSKSVEEIGNYVEALYDCYQDIEGGEKIMERLVRCDTQRDTVAHQNEVLKCFIENQPNIKKLQDLQMPPNLADSRWITKEEDRLLTWAMCQHGVTNHSAVHVALQYYYDSNRGYFRIATRPAEVVQKRCAQIVNAVGQYWDRLHRPKTRAGKKRKRPLSGKIKFEVFTELEDFLRGPPADQREGYVPKDVGKAEESGTAVGNTDVEDRSSEVILKSEVINSTDGSNDTNNEDVHGEKEVQNKLLSGSCNETQRPEEKEEKKEEEKEEKEEKEENEENEEEEGGGREKTLGGEKRFEEKSHTINDSLDNIDEKNKSYNETNDDINNVVNEPNKNNAPESTINNNNNTMNKSLD